jgi:hypothetical protein
VAFHELLRFGCTGAFLEKASARPSPTARSNGIGVFAARSNKEWQLPDGAFPQASHIRIHRYGLRDSAILNQHEQELPDVRVFPAPDKARRRYPVTA